MTPNDIEVLIHCYVSPSRHPRYSAEAVIDAYRRFEDNGLIVNEGDGVYTTTDLGEAHIQQLCSLPLPKLQYVRFDGVLINPLS